jgi:hypothetical protein
LVVYCNQTFFLEDRNTDLSNALAKMSLFSSKTAWEKIYKKKTIITEQLLVLRDLTGLQFQGKIRRQPAYTVDALYKFSSYLDAEKVKDALDAKSIIAHIVTLNDDQTNRQMFQLCVPAINAGQYATSIARYKM